MQSKPRFSKLQLLALVVMLSVAAIGIFSVPAKADNLYASIRGSITDPTGAVVSGVSLSATNAATGIAYTTTTNSSGAFTFLQLPIGDYTLKVAQPGYKAYEAAGIHLDLDQIYNLPIKLTLGAATEQIVVEANPVQVDQVDMQLGTTVTAQQIVDIPLNGRNWTQLQQLQPGIIGTSDRFGGNSGGFSGNGAETQQNSFLINGVDSNDASLNTALVIPSPDAIGEFRLITSTINPEYGRNSGTVINANIKNGTNVFHGSAFEFYRDTFLDAKNYFEPQASPFHQNQYGGTIGGPIFRDKAFFFFSYQGEHQRVPQSGAGNEVPVYSVAQRGGDFSDAIAGGPFPGNSAVPLNGDADSPCPVGTAPCAAGTAYSSLFSTGMVPTSDFNSISTKLVNQFVPNPNVGTNEFQFNPITTATVDQYLGRIDYKLTNSDAIWFYGLYQTNPSVDSLPFTGTTLPGLGEQAQRHQQQYSASWTHTFSPTTLNELRVGYTRFNFAAVEPLNQFNPTSYGFTGITPQAPVATNLPLMTVTGLFTLGFSNNGPQPRIQNVYQLTDNFSKVAGHHTFKAGFNFDRLSIDNPFYNSLNGNFGFNGAGPNSTGDPGLDFLLGIPGSYAQGSGSIVDAKAHELYAYFQDQWQIRPNLTITYGSGYDIETPWLNHYDKGLIMAAFRPGQQSTVFPTAPPGFVYPGDAGISKYGGMSVKYDLFAPRLGFAWSPGASHNWSVHGGIGMYYNRSEEELALETLTNAPFALTSGGASPCGNPGFANPYLLANGSTCSIAGSVVTNPFPFVPPSPGATNINFATYAPIGLGFNTEDPRFTSPRSTNFNLTIERQLDKATILSVAYVGNRGRHEEGAINLNIAGTYPGVNTVAANAGCFTGLFLADAPCPQTPVTPNANLTFTNGTPVPGASPYNLALYGHPGEQLTEFNSKYDSLQVTLNRRFSQGLQVLAAYTWSRYFDQTSSLENSAFNFPGVNSLNPADMWAPSANDAPQRFVVSFTYTLPFYKFGHHFRALTDDWNLVGIYTLQHGTPVPVFDFSSSSLTCDDQVSFYACPDRADRTSAPLGIRDPRNHDPGNANGGTNPTNLYFNPAAFGTPAPGQGIGNASRNPLYGPGINYGDMALEKRIHITEQKYFELRLETYNTFNHTNFANPATPGFNAEDVSEGGANPQNSLFGPGGPFGQVFATKTISTLGEGRAVQLGAKFYF
jgi:hypothetical protein